MAKCNHGEELKLDQQNFPDLSMDHPLFAFRRKLSGGLLVLKLDAHLEAAAEKKLLRVLEAHELSGLSLGECMRSNLAAHLP